MEETEAIIYSCYLMKKISQMVLTLFTYSHADMADSKAGKCTGKSSCEAKSNAAPLIRDGLNSSIFVSAKFSNKSGKKSYFRPSKYQKYVL
jgi:hypothetical protein